MTTSNIPSSPATEAIADAAHRFDEVAPRTEFLANLDNVLVERARRAGIIASPQRGGDARQKFTYTERFGVIKQDLFYHCTRRIARATPSPMATAGPVTR